MKIFICFATLVIASSAIDTEFLQDLKEKIKSFADSCAKEVSATSDDLATILNHQIPASREGKCVFFCVHKLFNAQEEDGTLNMNGALSNLEMLKDADPELHAKVSTSFKNCESAPKDKDPCVYAANLAECVMKEQKAAGLI